MPIPLPVLEREGQEKKEIYKIRGTNNGSRGALSLSALIIDSRMFNKVKY